MNKSKPGRFGDSASTRRLVGGCALLCVCIGLGAKYYWPQPSLESMGVKAINCLRNGDQACLQSFVTRMEADKLDTDQQVIAQFLVQYVTPVFKDASPIGNRSVNKVPDKGWVYVGQDYVLSGGRVRGISFRVVEAEKGVKIPTIVLESILLAANARRELSDTKKEGRPLAVAKLASEDGAKLEAMGIRGVWRDTPDAVLTWDELAHENLVRAQRVAMAERL